MKLQSNPFIENYYLIAVFFSRPHFSIYDIFIQNKTHEVSTQGALTSKIISFQIPLACRVNSIKCVAIFKIKHCDTLNVFVYFRDNDMFSIEMDHVITFQEESLGT